MLIVDFGACSENGKFRPTTGMLLATRYQVKQVVGQGESATVVLALVIHFLFPHLYIWSVIFFCS